MADKRLVTFSREAAQEILDAVRYLRANGFALQAGNSRQANQWTPPPIYVKNVNASAAPAFACMQVVGTIEVGGQNYLEVDKPADNIGTAGPYVFNGPREIAASALGIAFDGPVVRTKVNGTITENARYAPRVSNWDITAETNGPIVCLGSDDIATGIAKVHLVGPWQRKPLVRFTLSAALATSDASKTATITNQYGFGCDGSTSAAAITVHNLLTSTASTYVFEGDSGDAGLAMWDSGTNYRIIQMECP
jgi:hypothetical protein